MIFVLLPYQLSFELNTVTILMLQVLDLDKDANEKRRGDVAHNNNYNTVILAKAIVDHIHRLCGCSDILKV
jgi:hypothetical protein